ncbi:probable sterol methyltransferase [hydrothermal vent metagenome]|uniref:Probable sterol methyltransferase n=1 Tax=hydrothermal vent metagenome TaxID=652676 RepID=A0A3B0RPF1_9ZZZZ
MTNENIVSAHYTHGDLLSGIETALITQGKNSEDVTIDDLAPVDEFHIGGRLATEHFLDQLNFTAQSNILDVGCGLGGPARFAANRYNVHVTGIDLTPEFIETGQVLCQWVGLDKQVTLHQGSALSMPFADGSLDGGYMLHVGMNIADKAGLFREIYRVLRPGVRFGVYDVMRLNDGNLCYPVPWANDDSTSSLASPAEYRQLMADAGFVVMTENNRHDFALSYFQDTIAKAKAAGGPPTLGIHVLIGATTAAKMKNMIKNISAGYIAPMEIIAQKQE